MLTMFFVFFLHYFVTLEFQLTKFDFSQIISLMYRCGPKIAFEYFYSFVGWPTYLTVANIWEVHEAIET